MYRPIAALAVALSCGCFSDPGSPATEEESESGSSSESSAEAESTESASTSTSSGVSTEGASGSSSSESSAGSEGSTGGAQIPTPRAVWLFEGDYTEEIAGLDATMVGVEQFVRSPDGQAAYVNPGSYIDASAAGPLVLESLGAVSFLVRLRWDSNVANQFIWALGKSGNIQAPADNSFALLFANAKLQLLTETGGGVDHVADLGYALTAGTGQWATLVVTVSTDTVRVYVDGEFTTLADYEMAETTATDFYIGGIENPSSPEMTAWLDGPIDEVRFWDVVLTDEQVLAVSEL